ncbi:MAG: ATP-binding protein [Abditibacteriales bacterium]|nr:ATP-binding protein [Abditibacteriales bacterium]MDW8367608.1 ATP-binding protein [Abditibacteriales bacterium]
MEGRLRGEWHLWKIRWLSFLLIGAWSWYHARAENVRVLPWLACLTLFTVGYSVLLRQLLRSEQRRWYPVFSLIGDVILITGGVGFTGWNTPLILLYLLPLVAALRWYGPLALLIAYILILVGNVSAGWWLLPDKSGAVQVMMHWLMLGVLALGGVWLTHEGQRHRLALNALQGVAHAMRSVADRQSAWQQWVTAARDLLDVEKVIVLLYDRANDQLVPQPPAAGITEEALSQMRVPRGEDISWQVFASGQPYVSQDTRTDPLVTPGFAERYGARALLCVPLQSPGEPIGVVHAINKRGHVPFTAEDCQLLMLLGSQMSLFLSNARLHDDRQREQTLLSAILHSVPSGVIVTDSQDEIILMNPSASHLLQVTTRDAQGRALASVVAEPQVVSLLERARHSHAPLTEEITLTHSGYPVVRVDCTPVADESGKRLGQVAVFHDITEQRRLAQMQSEFIAAVSHELRTPLTSIKAFAATLLRDVEFDRATQREFLGIINSQCDRLSRIINDLLQVSRIESGRPLELHYTTVDVRAVMQRVVRSESLLTSKHRFETNVQPEAESIEADEEKLTRILTNLVNNAWKYSPDGGVITLSARAEDDTILFAVRDEGIGIPAAEQAAIFEKFYQIDGSRTRRAGGSGVGLFLAKQLVTAHGGAIWVESEVGRGATFFFRLPRRHLARSASTRDPQTASAPSPLPQTADRG